MPLSDEQFSVLAREVFSGSGVELTRLSPADAPSLVDLNDSAYPAVPITSVDAMRSLLEFSDCAVAIKRDGQLVGFVVTLGDGAAYESENYQFFCSRGVSSRYVDRIVIAESERGNGLGAALYALVFSVARAEGRAEVTCEVNLDPPNPASLAFHERLGFASVGTQATKGGTVTVSLLAAPVSA
ncbi:GNAT family N-acetyltransferase [Microcella sp.]|uniref:GNAT family N-acetyltransferase n=1 Tax=Microcella sp. TaxID=1913979 RepID=UPI00299F785B|nr:GNAT family N-acetyltransferase [Microcella sp.]MDX2025472.1 GNAT family N-acetyltransferase [Microcella sp.]